MGDAKYEAERYRRLHLTEAAEQLDAGGVPGFIVLARDHSSLVGNYCASLMQAIRTEQEKFCSVFGIVMYETEVGSDNVLPTRAHLCVRSERRSLLRELAVLQRGGHVTWRLF